MTQEELDEIQRRLQRIAEGCIGLVPYDYAASILKWRLSVDYLDWKFEAKYTSPTTVEIICQPPQDFILVEVTVPEKAK